MYLKSIPLIASVLVLIVLDGYVARKPNIIIDNVKEKRDYTPQKWIANSAMDIWYGNKSMVDIISRELKELMDRVVERRVRRSLLSNITENPFIPKIEMPLEKFHLKELEDKIDAYFDSIRNLRKETRNVTAYYDNLYKDIEEGKTVKK